MTERTGIVTAGGSPVTLVGSELSIGDAAPTRQSYAARDELLAAIDAELAKLDTLWTEDLPALNEQVLAAAVPALSIEGDR